MEKYSLKAKKLCELVASRILERRAQPIVWPTPVMEPYWYLKQDFLKEMWETIKKLERKGLNDKKIAKLFLTPARICYTFFYFADFPLNDCGLSINKREKLIEKLFNYLAIYRKEDICCKKGSDIIWTEEEVNNALAKYSFVDVENNIKNEKFRKSIGRLNALLWLYEEFIHMGRHQFGHQFHGPYPLGGKEFLFVREHVELRPDYIWPFTAGLPFNTLRSLEIYEGIEIQLTFFNHVESSGNLPKHLKKLFIISEEYGPILDLMKIESIASQFEQAIAKGNEETANWSKKDWLKKSVEMAYALLKPHKEILREDWRPSPEIYRLVETKNAKGEVKKLIDSAQSIFKEPKEKALIDLQNLLLKNIYAE